MTTKLAISREDWFSAAHRLHNPLWDNKKNEVVFGQCNNPNYHGHTYRLTVTLCGALDPYTGKVYDREKLGTLVNQHIIQHFNHKNLNLDLQFFKKLNPTTENIARVIWNILRPCIDKKYDLTITLYETEKNAAKYPNS